MIQKAFETGKEVRTKTSINRGFVSVSSAAVDLTGKKLGCFSHIKALSVGAGETGTIVVQNLAKKSCTNITIANRTHQKAINLASNTNSQAIEFSEITSELAKVDVVFYSTGSQQTLLSSEMMEPVMRERNNKPLLVVDLCMPRNVDSEIASIPGITLVDLDHLQKVVNTNFDKRKAELSHAEAIIEKAVSEFDEWMGVRRLKCAISSITEKLKDVNLEEATNYKKVKSNEETQKHIAEYGDHLSAKFTRMLIKQLRQITNEGKDPEKVKVVSELFNFSLKN
jgi:glutamyl-tRNA reductase